MTKKNSQQETVVSIIVFLVLCSLWALLSQIPLTPFAARKDFLGPDGFLAPFENQAIDARIKMRGSMDAPVKVCYVDVDTESISKLGNFPWNREYFAMALDALFKHGGIKAAGMDFVFSMAGIPALGREEAESGSKALGKSIHKNKNVVAAATFGTKGNFPFLFQKGNPTPEDETPELPAFPIVGPTWGHVGLIDTIGNDVRYIPFFAKTSNHIYLPMSLKLALLYWGLPASAVSIEEDEILVKKEDGTTVASIPLLMEQLVEPNWFGAWMEKDHHASIVHVMEIGRAHV